MGDISRANGRLPRARADETAVGRDAGSASEPEGGRARRGAGQELAVGIEAPAWMLAMAMATRVRSPK